MSRPRIAVWFCLFVSISGASRADFNIVWDAESVVGPDASRAIAGFERAGALWSGLLRDSITVNLRASYQSAGAGLRGRGEAETTVFSYFGYRTMLESDRKSRDDFTAASNLPSGSSFKLLVNLTSNNPNGPGNATPYLDADGNFNNLAVEIARANAKAIGLLPSDSPALDGAILLNSDVAFDFDPSDGIDADKFDFVGVAAHEIGHALGFFSGVDVLDRTGSLLDYQLVNVSPLDLFRVSQLSLFFGPSVIDWTADSREKSFSIDGGRSFLAGFSTGVSHGDGREAGHWRSVGSSGGPPIGLMSPDIVPGQSLAFSARDLQAFDVIGYDLAQASVVPEPGSAWLLAVGAILGLRARRRFTA